MRHPAGAGGMAEDMVYLPREGVTATPGLKTLHGQLWGWASGRSLEYQDVALS